MQGEEWRRERTVIVDVELDALACDWRNGAQCQKAGCDEFDEHGDIVSYASGSPHVSSSGFYSEVCAQRPCVVLESWVSPGVDYMYRSYMLVVEDVYI